MPVREEDDGQEQRDGQEEDGGQGGDGKDDPDPDPEPTTATNPCEPWPFCNQSSDPKPETTTTCVAPGRKPGHKHGDHGCHARTPGHTHGDDVEDTTPTDATNTPIADIIRDVGSLLSCEWASQSGGNVGLICDSIAFNAPLLWDDITGEDITGDKVLRDAGMWAACYRVGVTPRIRLACAALTIVVDPLADAIGKFSNQGSRRGHLEPPDPDKTDNTGNDEPPPPTGTTTPGEIGDNSEDGDSDEQIPPTGTTTPSDSADDKADPSDQNNGNNANDQGDEAEAEDEGGTPKTPAEWDQAVKEAEEKWRRNEIDGDELTRIQNLRDCAYGHPWAQNCT